MIFDSHAHYYDPQFQSDRDELLTRMHRDNDVGWIVCPSENLQSAGKCLVLARQYDFIYAAVGVHPHYADTWEDSHTETLEKLASDKKVVALGEMGLDYYRRTDNKEQQKKAFLAQLELAKSLHLPAIIHDREAHGDMYDILRRCRPEGVMHCFSGSVELMEEAVSDGLYIGLGGSVTAPNAVKPVEVAKNVPLERLVLETDAPYLIPAPYRKGENRFRRSESWMIRYVAEFIAALRGIDAEELLRITAENAARLFRVTI